MELASREIFERLMLDRVREVRKESEVELIKELQKSLTQENNVYKAERERLIEKLAKQVAKDIQSLLLRPNAIKDPTTIMQLVDKSNIGNPSLDYKLDNYVEAIASAGALHFGHFELLSKLHAEYFLMFSRIATRMDLRNLICSELYERMKNLNANLIIAPASAGGLLVSTMSEKFDAKPAFFEVNQDSRPVAVRTGYKIKSEDRVLIINDLATTGQGIKSMIDIVNCYDATVVGIGLFATRGEESKKAIDSLLKELKIPIEVLVHLKIDAVEEKNCRLCEFGDPMTYRSCMLNC